MEEKLEKKKEIRDWSKQIEISLILILAILSEPMVHFRFLFIPSSNVDCVTRYEIIISYESKREHRAQSSRRANTHYEALDFIEF